MTRRLFVFASYDKDSVIEDVDLYYLNALSKLGDIVFYMDNDVSDKELSKLNEIPNVLYAGGNRHGEYDFGSYKRGFFWAKEQGILDKYDWVYLVNNSAYGPLKPLNPFLTDLESRGTDSVSMFLCKNDYFGTYLQSWFMGFKPAVFNSEWFIEFFNGVKKYKTKDEVVRKCEFGFSKELFRNKVSYSTFMSDTENNDTFRNPLKTLRNGMPFIKRSQIALSNIGNTKKIKKYIPEDFKFIMDCHLDSHGLYINKYEDIFGLNLFSLPILEIYKNRPVENSPKKYKIKLFRFLPVLIIKIKDR